MITSSFGPQIEDVAFIKKIGSVGIAAPASCGMQAVIEADRDDLRHRADAGTKTRRAATRAAGSPDRGAAAGRARPARAPRRRCRGPHPRGRGSCRRGRAGPAFPGLRVHSEAASSGNLLSSVKGRSRLPRRANHLSNGTPTPLPVSLRAGKFLLTAALIPKNRCLSAIYDFVKGTIRDACIALTQKRWQGIWQGNARRGFRSLSMHANYSLRSWPKDGHPRRARRAQAELFSASRGRPR